MGMFDEVRCKYPLPVPELQGNLFQTKSFDCPYMELYEIREDGTLWHEDVERAYQADPDAPLGYRMDRVRESWEQVRQTMEVRFYNCIGESDATQECGWIEFSAYFVEGQLRELHTIQNRPIQPRTT